MESYSKIESRYCVDCKKETHQVNLGCVENKIETGLNEKRFLNYFLCVKCSKVQKYNIIISIRDEK